MRPIDALHLIREILGDTIEGIDESLDTSDCDFRKGYRDGLQAAYHIINNVIFTGEKCAERQFDDEVS